MLEQRLKEVISSVLEIDADSLNPESSTKTIASWDSLRHMNLIIAIEDEFDISIEDEAILQLTSYGSIMEYLKSAL